MFSKFSFDGEQPEFDIFCTLFACKVVNTDFQSRLFGKWSLLVNVRSQENKILYPEVKEVEEDDPDDRKLDAYTNNRVLHILTLKIFHFPSKRF